MAGNTLDRPLFKMGPQGDMRPQFGWGGAFNPKNWRWPWPRPGHQYEMWKYGENVPVAQVDDFGRTKNIDTQTVTPKKRYDVETNVYGQPIENQFYGYDRPKETLPPVFETTPSKTTTNLFGETVTTGGETKINFGNIYNAPFTNFGTIKKRWGMMSPEQKKSTIKNVIATGTIWTMLPDWMKDDPVAKEMEQSDVNETLEKLDLPKPAMSYEEATTWGPEGDPSIIMAGAEEYAKLADEEIVQKEKELQEEKKILDTEPVSIGEREAEYDKSLQEGVKETAEEGGLGTDKTMFDMISAMLGEDTEIDAKGIEETKAELKSLMGDESKMMNTMMLLQLGLSMMSGTTSQSGLGGFLDVASKAGKEILPIAMQNLANKSKMDKELALAAYDIVRDERKAKAGRMTDIQDFYMKEMIKKSFETVEDKGPQGTLRDVMKKNVLTLPDGQEYLNWIPIDQVFDKGERAAWYLDMSRNGNKEFGVQPGDIKIVSDKDVALAAGGADPYQGRLTASQRGEHLALSAVFEAALPEVLNLQMNPEWGLYSGELPTGFTASWGSFFRTLHSEAKQVASRLGVPGMYGWYENTGNASYAALDVQMSRNMILSGAHANRVSETGSEDIFYGEGELDGVTVTREWATDSYVKNLISNPNLDVITMMENRMGFLAARLKQPTGRLLADTIRRSIEEVQIKSKLFDSAGGPEQVANRLHMFTKDLYQQYVKHSLLGGTKITQSWAVKPELYGKDRITIMDYQQGYDKFINARGGSANLPIDMAWVQIQGNISSSAPAYSGTGGEKINATGPANFFQLAEKWDPIGDQTFGDKSFTGAQ